jgi:hypothetical protein
MTQTSTHEPRAARNGQARTATKAFADPLPDPIVPKPGFLTSEFFQTLLTNALAVVVSVGSVFGHKIATGGVQALVAPVAVLAAAIATVFYSRSRSQVKNAVVEANTAIEVARSQQSH